MAGYLAVGCKGTSTLPQPLSVAASDAAVAPLSQPVPPVGVVRFIDQVRLSFPQTKLFKAPAGVTLKAGIGACSVDGLDLLLDGDVSVPLSELHRHWGSVPAQFMVDWKQDGAGEVPYVGGDATLVVRRRGDSDFVESVSFIDLRNCGNQAVTELSDEQKRSVLTLLKNAASHAGSSLSAFCSSVGCEWIDESHALFRPTPGVRLAAGQGTCGPAILFDLDQPAAPLLADLEGTFGAVDPNYLKVRVKEPIGWIRNSRFKLHLRLRGAFVKGGKTYIPWIELQEDEPCRGGAGESPQ